MSGQTNTTSRQMNGQTSTMSGQTSITSKQMSTTSSARVLRVTRQVMPLRNEYYLDF